MGTRATAGTCLPALVKMAVSLCKGAERRCPRTGPGAKPVIPDWLIGVLIMVAVLKRKKSKSAQFCFLSDPANRRQIAEAAGCEDFPSRSTFFRRHRRAYTLLRTAIQLRGQKAIPKGVCDPEVVSVDKSLIAARGPLWHKRDRQAGRIPKGLHGVDRESTWGYSQHDGWGQGYSFEVVVSATAGSTVFPLVASADTASAKETQSCREKMAALPENVHYVLADSGYDSNELAEHVEYDEDRRRTGRRFLCPENRRGETKKTRSRPKPSRIGSQPKHPSGWGGIRIVFRNSQWQWQLRKPAHTKRSRIRSTCRQLARNPARTGGPLGHSRRGPASGVVGCPPAAAKTCNVIKLARLLAWLAGKSITAGTNLCPAWQPIRSPG